MAVRDDADLQRGVEAIGVVLGLKRLAVRESGAERMDVAGGEIGHLGPLGAAIREPLANRRHGETWSTLNAIQNEFLPGRCFVRGGAKCDRSRDRTATQLHRPPMSQSMTSIWLSRS